MSTKNPSEQIILVTGASGFVAGHVLSSFLDKGYNVRGTVRSESTAEQVRKLHAKYSEQLTFVIVPDMSLPGAFDEAVKGVDGVIHTASPFTFDVKDMETELLIPAINGSKHILEALAAHAPNAKRMVLTSSFASIVDLSGSHGPGYTYSEDDWNPCTYDEAKSSTNGAVAYCASKALAEHAAFDWVKEHQPTFDLTTICPPMIYGPLNHTVTDMKKLNQSSADIYRFVNGSMKEGVGSTDSRQFCDVRDVAEAHLRAYETPAAGGQRFAITSGNFFYEDVAAILREEFPESKDKFADPTQGEYPPVPFTLSNERAKQVLGMTFRPLKETIIDTARSLFALEKSLA
jgi:nucleoside-diphosphate-sugar epimerase